MCVAYSVKLGHYLVLCFYFQGSEQEGKGLPCKKGIVQSVVGQGYQRKIILASQSTQSSVYRLVSTFVPQTHDPTKIFLTRFLNLFLTSFVSTCHVKKLPLNVFFFTLWKKIHDIALKEKKILMVTVWNLVWFK